MLNVLEPEQSQDLLTLLFGATDSVLNPQLCIDEHE